MGLNSLEMHFTEKAASYIHEAGGKIGGLNFLKARVPQLTHAILPVQVITHDEGFTGITVPPGDDGRFIVRGSDPRDFQGLVDVIKTEVGEIGELNHLVDNVRKHAKLPEVLAYGQYENPGYKGKISVGVQPYLGCQRGSIVEHPNRPNNYVISFIPKDYETGIDSAITFIYDAEVDEYKHISGPFYQIEGDYEKRPKQIIELYKLVDSSGLVKPGYSFQMEFLNSPDQVFVAQVRAFMQKQLATFELEGDERLVFGITPPNGVILPVYLSTDGFSSGDYPNYETPWAYLKLCEKRKGVRDIFSSENEEEKAAKALKFNPRNLAAYLIGQSFGSQINTSLEHNHFRMAQKANLTIFEGYGRRDYTKLLLKDPGDVKAFSGLYDQIEKMAGIDCRSIGDMVNTLYEGRLLQGVKIVSDGKNAIVKPVRASKRHDNIRTRF